MREKTKSLVVSRHNEYSGDQVSGCNTIFRSRSNKYGNKSKFSNILHMTKNKFHSQKKTTNILYIICVMLFSFTFILCHCFTILLCFALSWICPCSFVRSFKLVLVYYGCMRKIEMFSLQEKQIIDDKIELKEKCGRNE